MKFPSGDGLWILKDVKTMTNGATGTRQALVDAINALDTPGGVGTPTGTQLNKADQYYGGQANYTSPIQLTCQPNFVILISDGLYTGNDPRGEAETLYTTDHYGTSADGVQNVIVHTISRSAVVIRGIERQ